MSDLDDLQGTWEAVQVLCKGEPPEEDEDEDPTLFQFEGNTVLVGDEYAAWDHEVVIDDLATPRSIDIIGSNLVSRGPDDPYHRLGIYRVEGDTLLICLNDKDSDPRPTAFESTAENRYWLYRLQRTDRRID